MLWPDHCVQGTRGAGLAEEVEELVTKEAAAGRHIHRVKLVDAGVVCVAEAL